MEVEKKHFVKTTHEDEMQVEALWQTALEQKKMRDYLEKRQSQKGKEEVQADDDAASTAAPASSAAGLSFKSGAPMKAASSVDASSYVPTEPAKEDEEEGSGDDDMLSHWSAQSSRTSRSRVSAARSSGRKAARLQKLKAHMEKVAGDKFVWEDKQNALNLSTAQREVLALSALAPAPASSKVTLPCHSVTMATSPLNAITALVAKADSMKSKFNVWDRIFPNTLDYKALSQQWLPNADQVAAINKKIIRNGVCFGCQKVCVPSSISSGRLHRSRPSEASGDPFVFTASFGTRRGPLALFAFCPSPI
jgi:hypothetical protein